MRAWFWVDQFLPLSLATCGSLLFCGREISRLCVRSRCGDLAYCVFAAPGRGSCCGSGCPLRTSGQPCGNAQNGLVLGTRTLPNSGQRASRKQSSSLQTQAAVANKACFSMMCLLAHISEYRARTLAANHSTPQRNISADECEASVKRPGHLVCLFSSPPEKQMETQQAHIGKKPASLLPAVLSLSQSCPKNREKCYMGPARFRDLPSRRLSNGPRSKTSTSVHSTYGDAVTGSRWLSHVEP